MTLFAPPSQQSATRTVGRSSQSIVMVLLFSLMLLGALGSRLAFLQLVHGKENYLKARENQIRLIPKPPERGRIYDRNGKLLATSRISHSLYVWPVETEAESWPQTQKVLSKIINLPESEIEQRIETAENQPYRVRIARDLTQAQIVAIQENRRRLKGVEVQPETIRYYQNGDLAAHVLGYTREVTRDDLDRLIEEQPRPTDPSKFEDWEKSHYRSGDVIGKAGVEFAFEDELRGDWGGKQVQVNAAGDITKVVGQRDSRQGQDIRLTLDIELQKAAEKTLGNNMGAIVAMDPRNGEVLAMVSRPAFDPNLFSKPLPPAAWNKLNAPDAPLVNRAISAFPPASTFKIVTTSAGIESGAFPPNTVLPTYPFLEIGGNKFWDWNDAGFGPLDFTGAMAMSSDTFFYQVGQRIGGETLIDWTKRFGFGVETGIELVREESPGEVPDNAWKQKYFDEPWYVGDTINMSIGQGFLITTPLQVANMFAVPANGGDLVRPHLRLGNEEARRWRKSVGLKPETLEILQRGLRRVVDAGTGPALNVPSLPPNAGKTGTAEDPPRESHVWYGGYAPLDDPEIIVVAFGENLGAQGGGGAVAAPMVRAVLETYFNGPQGQGEQQDGQQDSQQDGQLEEESLDGRPVALR